MTIVGTTKTATEIAATTGQFLARHFDALHRRDLHHKARTDIVTDIDLAANKKIVVALHQAFPTHGIISEEGHNHQTRDGYTWLVDPIDGTSNYAAHISDFAISLALTVNGVPLLGVILAPVLQQTFVGVVGQGATLNGKHLRVSTTKKLRDSVVSVSAGYDRPTKPLARNVVRTLQPRVKLIRNRGAVSLDLAAVAAGWSDAAIKCGPVHAWDVTAGCVLAREAGAIVTDVTGNTYTNASPLLLVASPAIHQALCQRLA